MFLKTVRSLRVPACALAVMTAVSQPALAQTADDAMAMRWWNALNGEQMVAALHGDSATMAQEVAAKKMYADLDNLTKMLVNDTAATLYGEGRFTSVGEWWETLNCTYMRIATGDGNTHDSSSAYCRHYPGSDFPENKILGSMQLAFVNTVGGALLGRDEPGEFLSMEAAMATRWWNQLNAEQMVAALFGDTATADQETAAKNLYADLDDATRMLVDAATAEIYGSGGFASVGAWWESLDCRKMRIAAGDGNMADSSSPYCRHYPGSDFPPEKILKPGYLNRVNELGMYLLRRAQPGTFPTPYSQLARRWWNALNGEQMVASLHGDSATAEQAEAAQKMYDDLGDYTRYLVNHAVDTIYGEGRYPSVGAWWEMLNCTYMRIAVGDGNTHDPMSPYCAHYPGSGLAKILSDMGREHVDKVGMALLDRATPGRYPAVYELPLFPSASDMHMREGMARIVNRGPRAVEVSIEAFNDAGRPYGPATLTIDAGAVAHFNSSDLEMGNAMAGLMGGVGAGMGHWRLNLTSTLPLRALAYVRGSGGLSPMHEVVPRLGLAAYNAVVFMGPADERGAGMLRITNPTRGMAHVRIEGTDDTGAMPGSAVELEVGPRATKMLDARLLEEGGTGVMGALGDGEGSWRLNIHSNQRLTVMSLIEDEGGHLTNVSSLGQP